MEQTRVASNTPSANPIRDFIFMPSPFAPSEFARLANKVAGNGFRAGQVLPAT